MNHSVIFHTNCLSLNLVAFLIAARTSLDTVTFFASACLSRCSFNSGSISTVKMVLFIWNKCNTKCCNAKYLQNIFFLICLVRILSYLYINKQGQQITPKAMKYTFNKRTLFIANGKWFTSLDAVEKYANENGWRVSNIEKKRGTKNNFPYQAIVTLEAT